MVDRLGRLDHFPFRGRLEGREAPGGHEHP